MTELPNVHGAASLRRVRPIIADMRKHLALIVPLAIVAIACVAAPSLLRPDNIANMALQLSPLGIVALGQMAVIMVGGLDLSVGSVMATAAVLTTVLSGQNADLWYIIPGSLLMGMLVGLANGVLITKRQVSPFLATLAMMIVLQGARSVWTQGQPSGNVPPLLRTLGAGMSGGVPNNLAVLVVLAVLVFGLVQRSVFGRRLYLVGGNPLAARLVGISVSRITITAYVISGVLASIAGLILAGYVSAIDNWVGRGYELDSIVAAVIGGVALSGGRGTVTGALLGAVLLVILSTAVVLLGLPVQLQLILKGTAIIVAAASYVSRSDRE